jgi:hypothetical protein
MLVRSSLRVAFVCLLAMSAPTSGFVQNQAVLRVSVRGCVSRRSCRVGGVARLKMALGKGTALVYNPEHIKHSGFMHPEHPSRCSEPWEKLQSSGLAGQCREIAPREATMEELRSIHTEEYLEELFNGKPTMDDST